jgi:glycosyltransferase involved in cell wall biosynthesis
VRILYLIDSLAPGGAERSLLALAPHYTAHGVTLEIGYLHDRPGLQRELEAAGAELFCLAGAGGRVGWSVRARKLVLDRRPDLVHTTLFEADIAGRVSAALGRTPVVSSLVNVEYGFEQLRDPLLSNWKIRAAQLLDTATSRVVVRFHAITDHVAAVMSDRLRIQRSRIDVIPRGRDPEALGIRSAERRVLARNQLGLDPRTPLVLAVGRQQYQKGFDVLLGAWPRVLRDVSHARLIVAGREAAQTASLMAMLDRSGIGGSVQFIGSRADVPELLCASDVFVLPSRWEGLGSVLLEAMALEAPIVASDLPAVREIVADRVTARLVPAEQPDLLARGITESLSDPHNAGKRARAAREVFFHQYTVDRIGDQMIAFYERALDAARRPRVRAGA